MKLFSECINALARTRGQLEKQKLLENYFDQASDSDKLWALALLSGRKPKRTIRSTQLKNWSIEISQIPEWLFEESYQTVGDLAETISLLLNQKDNSIIDEEHSAFYSLTGIMLQFKNLEKATEAEKKEWITWMWEKLDRDACFVFNKLITGGFRIGVSEKTIAQALSEILNTDQHKILHRLSGNWSPYSTTWEDLLLNEITSAAQPYPFYLCYPLDQTPENLGSPDQWIAEWKWDGIRGQIIKRDDSCFIWSRGDELISDAFPELMEASTSLPNGTVLDGEIICMKRPYETLQPLTFSVLQKRIGRKKPGKKILEEAPVAFIVYDLLEWETNDIRRLPLSERRKLLEHLISSLKNSSMIISPVILFDEWEKMLSYRSEARKNLKEGLMLKKKDSVYLTGRKKGDWWKWKTDPLTIDCVLTYAQRGHEEEAGCTQTIRSP